MKKSLFMSFFVGLFGLSLVVAQAPNQECLTNLSIFVESAKVKNYDAAYEPWKMVYETCPDINRANYLYGERILKDKIDKSTGEEHDAFVVQLLELYDKAAQYLIGTFCGVKGMIPTLWANRISAHSVNTPAQDLTRFAKHSHLTTAAS